MKSWKEFLAKSKLLNTMLLGKLTVHISHDVDLRTIDLT